jgi:hypothetical protein
MFRFTTAIPRLAACAVCVTSAVVVQRRRKTVLGQPRSLDLGNHGQALSTRAAGTLAPTVAAVTTQAWSGPLLSGYSTALVRTLCHVLRHMWLSVAIGAAASLATVNAKMVASLKQLQVCPWALHCTAPPVLCCAARQAGVRPQLSYISS